MFTNIYQKPLRVLITNITLASRTGTETFVRDFAQGLAQKGHIPLIYSPKLGSIAEEIRLITSLPVVDNLKHLPTAPDIIHGHHSLETMTALMQFPHVPAIFVCHDRLAWHDVPPKFPRILRYVAVSNGVWDRLVLENGISENKVNFIYNAVDTQKFSIREPLPEIPKKALVFSNYANKETYLPVIYQACKEAGLSLDVIGAASGNSVINPEQYLGYYDIVFAVGRCALEAMATGAAVILCGTLLGTNGLGPMVTSTEWEQLRNSNFGKRAIIYPFNVKNLLQQIARYNPKDAAMVCERTRSIASLENVLQEYIALYQTVIEEHNKTTVVPKRTGLHQIKAFFSKYKIKFYPANFGNTKTNITSRDDWYWQQELQSVGTYIQSFAPLVIKSYLWEHKLQQDEINSQSIQEFLTSVPVSFEDEKDLKLDIKKYPIEANSEFYVYVELENNSNRPIGDLPPFPLRLCYHWLSEDGATILIYDGIRTPILPILFPKQKRIYEVKVVPPNSQSGNKCLLQITLVQEKIKWFDKGNLCQTVVIELLLDHQ